MVHGVRVTVATGPRGRPLLAPPTDDRSCPRLSRERAMTTNSEAPAVASPATVRPARVAGTLAAACVAVLVAQIANALPASLNGLFQTELHATGSQLTWITAAFMIAVVV